VVQISKATNACQKKALPWRRNAVRIFLSLKAKQFKKNRTEQRSPGELPNSRMIYETKVRSHLAFFVS